MTLFGTTLDGQQILSLVSLLMVLVFWIMVWKRQRRSDEHLNQVLRAKFPPTEDKRQAPTEDASKDTSKPLRGPWG